ncbi:MAG: PEGA domain-containing protein [Candidatus Eisenbacteria bacterium]|uniref:PEGA domain-containing protein n=1 Tax=Eiseniibacteriota bacterium TaxID=2212470 RepID=A0A948WDV7_UNCEI|nr:PEGA domain-containing protein [Candidatus Eisenbacteria bacterium]
MKNESAMTTGKKPSLRPGGWRLAASAETGWSIPPMNFTTGLIFLGLFLPLLFSACGGQGGLKIDVRDMSNNSVADVEIRQVGQDNRLLGKTNESGTATIHPDRGEGSVLIKLNRPAEDGRVYQFRASYTLSEEDFRVGVKVIRIEGIDGESPSGQITTSLLRLSSTPTGAEVWINGAYKGITPISLPDLAPGRSLVILTKQGWHPDSTEIFLEAGDEVEHFRELSATAVKTASLEILSDPSGAAIYIDGAPTNRTTPATLTDLQPGERRVRSSLSGYKNVERTVRLKAGGAGFIDLGPLPLVESTPAPVPRDDSNIAAPVSSSFEKRYGVSTAPYFAEVYIDGSDQNLNILGKFSLTLKDGLHRFRVINQQAGIDRVLTYEVKKGDPNDKLILDWSKGVVRAKKD